ncbi:MAG: bifunctional phosphoribosyl-AMP cyclohydrolase/phosphoribosyl-ATP diphosphatase HisIE [Bacteroidota bacterium]
MKGLFEGLHYDDNGLIPAVVQDGETGEVLMVAYMNEESLLKTLNSGETHFWSRSRQELWHKGGTSGNIQKVLRIVPDCDSDTLLVQVEQEGKACHTGHRSCFFADAHQDGKGTRPMSDVLGILSRTIRARYVEMPEGSYTTSLFRSGIDRILKKVGEEATEVVIAAKNRNREEIAWEVADLFYHLLVMLQEEEVTLGMIGEQLEKRFSKNSKED